VHTNYKYLYSTDKKTVDRYYDCIVALANFHGLSCQYVASSIDRLFPSGTCNFENRSGFTMCPHGCTRTPCSHDNAVFYTPAATYARLEQEGYAPWNCDNGYAPLAALELAPEVQTITQDMKLDPML